MEIKNKNKIFDNLLQKENVFAVGEGFKIIKGENTQKSCIVCFVSKKTDKISEKDRIPKIIEEIKTDVQEEKQPIIDQQIINHINKKKSRHRPVIVGTSGAGEQITGCTVGIPVYFENKKCLLVNQHCAMPVNGEVIDLEQEKRKAYLQPSTIDDGKYKTDIIGKVVKIGQIEVGKNNVCDSALIKLNDDISVSKNVYRIGEFEKEIVDTYVGQKLQKAGRTTGLTSFKVLAVNTSINIMFRINGRLQKILFIDQVIIDNAQRMNVRGGDSSSIVFTIENLGKFINTKPVGQIFAGSTTIGVFTPLKNVQKVLEFTLSKKEEEKEEEDKKKEKKLILINFLRFLISTVKKIIEKIKRLTK